ncbi:hypothetical protein [Streptomyces phaeochromogenes]|uniref:hypothetical protein n=1 Tax=Streptomyces phaeochromogenes TaxID=1923 RepID=UPI00371CBC7B
MQREVRLFIEKIRTKNESPSFIETVQLLVELRQASDQVLREVVEQARRGPIRYSWTGIGDALGVGRTAAQKRFGRGLDQARYDELKEELYQAIQTLKSELLRMKSSPMDDQEEEQWLQGWIDELTSRYGTVSVDQLELDVW